MLVAAVPAPSSGAEYCLWQCGGEPCRINVSDGYPVELLEFGITDGKTTDPKVEGESRAEEQEEP